MMMNYREFVTLLNVATGDTEVPMILLGGRPVKYWPPTTVCAVCVCNVCLVLFIAAHPGNKVILTCYYL